MNNKPVNSVLPVSLASKPQASILTLPFVASSIALNFVNTIDWRLDAQRRRDTLETYSDLLTFSLRLKCLSVDDYTRLLALAQEAPVQAETALASALAFRDQLAQLLDELDRRGMGLKTEGAFGQTLSAFESARISAHRFETLSWEGGHLSLAFDKFLEGLDYPWLLVVRDAENLLCSPLAAKIRVCAAEGCGWFFLDTSKNGTRRWCSMKLCGNREKAARFKAKGSR